VAFVLEGSGNAQSSDNAGVTTGNIDTTGADILIVCVMTYTGASQGALSDNQSNTFNQSPPTVRTSHTGSDQVRCAMYYATNPTVSAGRLPTLMHCLMVSVPLTL